MNKKDERSSFVRQVIGCLTSPRSSFNSILKKPSLLRAAVLIFAIAIIAAWANYNYMGKLPLTFTPEEGSPFLRSEQLRQPLMIVSAVMGLIGVFVGWLISSALLHVFSRVQEGKGAFGNILTLAGYASTPLIIQHILRLVDSFIIAESGILSITERIQISPHPFINTIANAALDTFSIFRIWSMALLVIAVHEYYKTSTVRSMVSVIGAFIVLMLLSIFLPL